MKLLNVEVVLERDKGLHWAGCKVEVLKELDDKTTSYAIVSHRWGTEVSYEEIIGLMKMEEEEREEVKQRGGYHKILVESLLRLPTALFYKIIKSCEQAIKDGYKWLWIDTCCIDKRSSSELSEAINSMYRWYQNAQSPSSSMGSSKGERYGGEMGEKGAGHKWGKEENKVLASNGEVGGHETSEGGSTRTGEPGTKGTSPIGPSEPELSPMLSRTPPEADFAISRKRLHRIRRKRIQWSQLRKENAGANLREARLGNGGDTLPGMIACSLDTEKWISREPLSAPP
ncbi:hypothetical protein EDC04DRAFT_2981122 [Pisolithus marmoratus]|nr:hypothetical protein EDC04DRAFT_2981122 [Pisolithus marmoratus]